MLASSYVTRQQQRQLYRTLRRVAYLIRWWNACFSSTHLYSWLITTAHSLKQKRQLWALFYAWVAKNCLTLFAGLALCLVIKTFHYNEKFFKSLTNGGRSCHRWDDRVLQWSRLKTPVLVLLIRINYKWSCTIIVIITAIIIVVIQVIWTSHWMIVFTCWRLVGWRYSSVVCVGGQRRSVPRKSSSLLPTSSWTSACNFVFYLHWCFFL